MSKAEPQFAISDRFLDQPYTLAGRLIDPVSGMLSWQGKCEHLRRKELEVLALLASADGKQVSRDNFIAVVGQGNDLVGDRGLSNTIVFVRKSLRDDDAAHPVIRTIPRRGYQLAVPVQQPPESAVAGALVNVEAIFVPGGMIPECPGWRLVRRLSQTASGSQPDYDSWLAEPSEFGERELGLRVFRFCRSEMHLQRLRREVTLLRYLRDALVDNQHFALIQDWQLDEPPYYLARDYTAFGTLAQWRGLADATLVQRMAMMQGLCDAVAAMHALGVIHRQLHADTILVDSAESGPQLKISAFDLAALSDRSALAPLKITAAGLTIGVGEAGAELGTADDVLAVGAVLLQLMLGDLHAQPSAESISGVANPSLQELLSRCLGPAPARPSASELTAQLRGLISPETAPVAAIASTAEAVKAPSAAIPKPLTTPLPIGVPTSIGNYHLLDRLGEGGMGTVYLAEQRAPVYRKVALKIIRAGLDGKQILSRFDAERQALAMMNHPNVAAVHESGMADDGRPFFAMEYIAGDDITSYCDAHHLNLSARIKLFLQVCDGVLHAHQKGVLHRDIKPSNLMVSQAPENAGTVKVIDFGLAKSLHGKLASHTLHTSFGAFIGTPIYSSPEHVIGAASGVDTRSDIYSMGVVLYELLAGRTPIATESLENLEPEKVREIVCKSKLPSMREQLQNTSAEKRAEIAEHRAIKLDELPKTLEGDLSWVVGKCLERDPNDRYASVLELKKDLERWLELRPVEARPTTSWYRFRKLVLRNRGASILIAASAVALLSTTTVAFTAYVRAEREREAANVSRAEAEMAADFQVKQIQDIDPASMGIGLRAALKEAVRKLPAKTNGGTSAQKREQGLDTAIRGVNFTDLALKQLDIHSLKPALTAITRDYEKHPLLQALLWQSIAETYKKFGLNKQAIEVATLAQKRRSELLGPKDPGTLASLLLLANIHRELGKLELAERELRALREVAQAALGDGDPLSLKTTSALGWTLSKRGNFKEAELLQREALEGTKRIFGADHAQTMIEQFYLVSTLVGSGKQKEALPLAENALSYSRSTTNLDRLAMVYWGLGKFVESEALVRELIQVSSKEFGALHPTTRSARGNLANLLINVGKYAEGEAQLRQLIEEDLIGDGYVSKANLGSAIARQGRYLEAEKYLGALQKELAQFLGNDHPLTLSVRFQLGEVLRKQGRMQEAMSVHEEIYRAKRAALGEMHPEVGFSLSAMAQINLTQHEFKIAEERFRKALDINQRVFGEEHPASSQSISDIGALLEAQGKYAEAEVQLRKALSLRRRLDKEGSEATLENIASLISVLQSLKRFDEASVLGKELVDLTMRFYDAKYYRSGAYFTKHARTLIALRRFDEAESLLDTAKTNLAQGYNPNPQPVLELAQAYVELYDAWGKASKAELWRQTLKAVERAKFGAAAEALHR